MTFAPAWIYNPTVRKSLFTKKPIQKIDYRIVQIFDEENIIIFDDSSKFSSPNIYTT